MDPARVMEPQGSGLIVSTASPAAVVGGVGREPARDRGLVRPAGPPRDIGAAVALLASEDGELITGQTVVVDAGLCAIGGDSPMATGRKAEPRMYGGGPS